jgi:nucleoside-diphosphate-sugar epimerase
MVGIPSTVCLRISFMRTTLSPPFLSCPDLPVDTVPPAASEIEIKARYIRVDLTDYGQVIGGLSDVDSGWKGVDAVIHLAAIPSPNKAVSTCGAAGLLTAQPNHVLWHTNMNQTYNVLEACRVLGIINVAIASSETVLGLPFHPHQPASFPVTESVERPESSYSLAKLMGEKMSEQHCRWNPDAKIVNIRLSNVYWPDRYGAFLSWQDDPWQRAWK